MTVTPYSYREYTGNGSNRDFQVPFPYLLKAHVKVYTGLDLATGAYTSLLVDGTNYIWTSTTNIQLITAPAVGVKVTVRRETPTSDLLSQWQDGSTLVAEDLLTSDRQNLYAVQEEQDLLDIGVALSVSATATANAATAIANTALATANSAAATAAQAYFKDGSTPMTGDVATGGFKVRNVGAPALSTDAATKGYVDGFVNQTANIADSAVTTAKIANDSVTTAKIPSSAVTTAKIADGNVTTDKINNSAVTESKLATDAVTVSKIKDGEITSAKLNPAAVVTNAEVVGSSPNDTSFFTTQASDSRYFRQDSSETITSGQPWSSSDGFVATTAAIDARVIDLVDDVGGFIPIASETSFPVNNPDINNPDNAGTIVSIKEIVTSRTPVSGTVTIANGAGPNTVTITGCGSTALPAGFGVLVETTATLHTYAFHRLVPKATEVTTVANISGEITTVAGISTSVTTVAASNSSVTTVAANIADVQAVAADLNEPVSEIETVAGSISNVNAVGTNIANVNAVAGNNANVTTVAGSIVNVNTTAGSIANVNAVGGNIANVNAVAANGANVTTVAGISANVTTVAGISGNVTTVAGISGNVTTVATSLADVVNASTYLNAFLALYLGQATADPSLDALGNPITTGDLYFNTLLSQIRVYNGTAWQTFAENAFGNTYFPNEDFGAVYTAAAGSNSINLGDLALAGGVFPDENSPTNRMSLALGAGSYNLGGL